MPAALDYVVLGHDRDEDGKRRRKLLMFNGAPPSMDPAFYVRLIDLEAMPDENGTPAPALALSEFDGTRLLLATIQPRPGNPQAATDHYVFMPAAALPESALQLEQWFAFLPEASQDVNQTLPALQPPTVDPISVEARARNLQRLLDKLPADSFDVALALLGALLHDRRLVIRRFPRDFRGRLALISSLQALLPGRLAARLTFASHAPATSHSFPQLAFADAESSRTSWVFDWSEPAVIAEALDHSYIEALRALWVGDGLALASEIQGMAPLAKSLAEAGDLSLALQRIAEGYRVDRQVRTPAEVVSTEAILSVLDGAAPPSDETRHDYMRKLLQNAFSERDMAAGRRVAEELDRDVELEAALADVFDEMLEDQPDAVYVFVRNRLTHLGIDDKWIPRLQTAARNSLEVAIEDADVGTLAGWLELIAHEPQSYQLSDVLRAGILLAKERAYADGELGIRLILIAVRRAPDVVDALYKDRMLISALETKVRIALQTPTAESLQQLVDERDEYFLLALYHGIQVSDEILVTLASAQRLWSLRASDERVNLPAVYRPPAIARLLATEASNQMTDDAVDYLFERIIQCDDRKLIADTAQHFADRDLLFPRISQALESDAVQFDTALSILNTIGGLKSALPHNIIGAYFSLLDYYQWEPQTQPLMEALARVMAKHHSAQVSYRHLWKLFDSCHAHEIEGATRVSLTHLLRHYGAQDDLQAVVDGLTRICRKIHLNKALGATVDNWWRHYTHGLSLTQLQRLERELESTRHLEAQKHILYSVLAMRRWLHSQSPVEFAESINATYSILEHITDAFDAAHIHEIDSYTIRREVDEVSGGLSSEQRHILATNLRNLAHHITRMAEKRSKPSLIRGEDSIERQLQHGEANPQGSIDMMKWIAGYLDGAHPDENP